ncbi:MAG: porin [Rubrivivax sp.]|nr:porin [Rubrivivax sp.]
MKKSLLALAALTAFAGAASAQSSVTLFGVVDVSARYTEYGNVDQYQLATDGNASSRLGFRGVEDLGGGLKAGFWIEGAMSADTGTAQGQTWQRRSTVSLMGGFGEIRLGRDYTATFWNWTVFDPFGTNGVGASTNLGLEVAGLVPGGSYGTLVRANNIIGYFLPAMGGFYGQIQQSAGENTNGNKYTGARLGYAAGPFNVAGAWGTTEVTPNLDGDNWNIAGSFKTGFGMFSAFYGMIEVGSLEQTNWFLGYQLPIGAFTLKASWGEVERTGVPAGVLCPLNNAGVSGTCVAQGDADQLALGFTYDLSKRTALYGTYSAISQQRHPLPHAVDPERRLDLQQPGPGRLGLRVRRPPLVLIPGWAGLRLALARNHQAAFGRLFLLRGTTQVDIGAMDVDFGHEGCFLKWESISVAEAIVNFVP